MNGFIRRFFQDDNIIMSIIINFFFISIILLILCIISRQIDTRWFSEPDPSIPLMPPLGPTVGITVADHLCYYVSLKQMEYTFFIPTEIKKVKPEELELIWIELIWIIGKCALTDVRRTVITIIWRLVYFCLLIHHDFYYDHFPLYSGEKD